MAESRVEIIGRDAFNPREWQRRELLWALVKVPIEKQLSTFMDGSAWYVQSGNQSRVDMHMELYEKDHSSEARSEAFFNQGKAVTAFLTWSGLLKLIAKGDVWKSTLPQHLKMHAFVVDKALAGTANGKVETPPEKTVFDDSRLLAYKLHSRVDEYGSKQMLLRASRSMLQLATNDLIDWMHDAEQNEAGTLETLTVYDGGTPRSQGEMMDSLLPVFDAITQSEDYLALSLV